MAQEIEYGHNHNLSVSPLVIKATMMNSTVHVLERDGSPWHPRASSVVGDCSRMFQSSCLIARSQASRARSIGTGRINSSLTVRSSMVAFPRSRVRLCPGQQETTAVLR
jgi:hypothetical protein